MMQSGEGALALLLLADQLASVEWFEEIVRRHVD